MASGYALPTAGGSHHGHSHSYSSIHLSPEKSVSNAFPTSNGHFVKKAVSNSALYTHAEASRETSPIPSPQAEYNSHKAYPSFDQNISSFNENARLHQNSHTHSRSMKSRPRGESNLGDPQYSEYRPRTESVSIASTSWFSLPEVLTSLLVPLPCLLASASYSSVYGAWATAFPPLSVYSTTQVAYFHGAKTMAKSSGLVQTGLLTSGTLLLTGVAAKLLLWKRAIDRRNGSAAASFDLAKLSTSASLRSMALRALSLGLPIYASMQLGGMRVGLVLLVSIAVNLTCPDGQLAMSFRGLKDAWSSKVATSVIVVLSFITDEIGLTLRNSLTNVLLGYLALAISAVVLHPPLPPLNSRSRYRSEKAVQDISVLTASAEDIDITLIAGVVLALITVLAATIFDQELPVSIPSIVLMLLTIASMASAILFSRPVTLRSQSKAGLALGCLITASCSFLFSPTLWPGTVCNGGLSALSFLSVLYDTNGVQAHRHSHDNHDHAHAHHHHHHTEGGCSAFTKFLLAHCEPGSLVSTILSEKDSRRIAYFTTLNFGFMIVQGAYGYLSGSLGLLSDTVHMFFDCLGLVIGLGAAVASKWTTSPEMPYGWGKLNTLAGFGNGIFLMLVSVEFVWEALEGIVERTELHHVQELLVVSTLGFLVNLVGLFAFGHVHAGHDHGHSHSHEHVHTNGHAHGPGGHHKHDHKQHSSHGNDQHHNENMHGIFLHVAADAGGSLAVILSTALTLWKPWYLWDPLATIIIAILIFAAAVPLVTSSGQKLLLVIPDELEYNIKSILQGLGELRGVIGYAAPRFWIDDKDDAGDSHGHHHGHEHDSHGKKQKIAGVIHIITAPSADLEDVRKRVEDYVSEHNMNLVIHVEREGGGEDCWCGGVGPQSG